MLSRVLLNHSTMTSLCISSCLFSSYQCSGVCRPAGKIAFKVGPFVSVELSVHSKPTNKLLNNYGSHSTRFLLRSCKSLHPLDRVVSYDHNKLVSFLVLGSGPKISIAILSSGLPTRCCFSGAFFLINEGFQAAHWSHFMHNCCTSLLNPGQ